MQPVLSRTTLNTLHLENGHAHGANQFDDDGWYYQVDVKFERPGVRTRLVAASVTITSINKKRQMVGNTIILGLNDRARFGEIVFLLAAKIKYDMLHQIPYDGAGFLHSDEIIFLRQAELTVVHKSWYSSLGRLYSQAVKNKTEFLKKFFLSPDQIWHLIYYIGATADNVGDQNLVWWLNVKSEAISFRNAFGEILIGNELEEILNKLFKEQCLYTTDNWKEFKDILDKLPRDDTRMDRVGKFNHHSKRAGMTDLRSEESHLSVEKLPGSTVAEHYIIEKIRAYLLDEAIRGLKHQLHSETLDSYIPLKLLSGKPHKGVERKAFFEVFNRRSLLRLGCNWSKFDEREFNPPKKNYVICSVPGGGKTTLLRHIEVDILRSNGPLAIYAEARKIFDIAPMTQSTLISYLAQMFAGSIPINHWEHTLTEMWEQGQLIFIVDGMSSLTNAKTNCCYLWEQLLKIAKNNQIIISGGLALIHWLKNYRNLEFVCPTPLKRNERKTFFCEELNKVANLNWLFEKKLLRIPLYAYLIRDLLKNTNDERSISAYALYSHLINYSLEMNVTKSLNTNSALGADDIRKALGKISYEAIDSAESTRGFISLNKCAEYLQGTSISVDMIMSTSVADVLEAQEEAHDLYLVFAEPVFQDYFVADWALRSQERMKHIESELGEIKWEVVARFLLVASDQFYADAIDLTTEKWFKFSKFMWQRAAAEEKLNLLGKYKDRFWWGMRKVKRLLGIKRNKNSESKG